MRTNSDNEDNTRTIEKIETVAPTESMQFLGLMRHACEVNGRSQFSVLIEMQKLQFFGNKLFDTEYFKYRLFDDGQFDEQQKLEFIGVNKGTTLNSQINSKAESILTLTHKIYFESILRGLGVSSVRTLAFLGDPSKFNTFGFLSGVFDMDSLRNFFNEQKSSDVFAKPLVSSKSLGAIGIKNYEEKSDKLNLTNGKTLDFKDFFETITREYYDVGYLFQRMISNHPELERVSGSAVGTVRVVTIRKEEGIEPLYAVWKIPHADSMSDNFWRNGNLVAAIDLESGRITRCQIDSGLNAKEISKHPENNQEIVGKKIPDWELVKKLAVDAAYIFPDLRIIGFDIAVSDSGPVVIEGNSNPDHALFQLANGRGFLNPEFKKLFDWNIMSAKTQKRPIIDSRRAEKLESKKRRRTSRMSDFTTEIEALSKKPPMKR